jgi:hypothetical protein
MYNSAINPSSLTDIQTAASNFFKANIPNLKAASLVNGEQDGKTFRFQYLNNDAPITVTQTTAELVDEANKKFKLIETTQSASGPTQTGRMTVVSKAYGIESFGKAL